MAPILPVLPQRPHEGFCVGLLAQEYIEPAEQPTSPGPPEIVVYFSIDLPSACHLHHLFQTWFSPVRCWVEEDVPHSWISVKMDDFWGSFMDDWGRLMRIDHGSGSSRGGRTGVVLGRRGRRRRTGRSNELGRRSGLAQITEDDWFVLCIRQILGSFTCSTRKHIPATRPETVSHSRLHDMSGDLFSADIAASTPVYQFPFS